MLDYLSAHEDIRPFYQYPVNIEGVKKAIEERKRFPVDRKLLAETLERQYHNLPKHDKIEQNIALLKEENTFTVCTAHQPNLLTGYLYFVYKIVHAIKLAEELKTHFQDKHFVPVYYMGSEDNDLDELGTFRYNNQKFNWNAAGQTGAVGRMKTESLKPLLDELFNLLGPPGENCNQLKQILTEAYLQQDNIADATRFLVNELFGRFGLLVLNPDEADFKRQFIPELKAELLRQISYEIVSRHTEQLSEHYKTQAHPRSINLFYLKGRIRERIEFINDHWEVVNTNIRFSEKELLDELDQHPERFSPNVILRGLFQEKILPNIAFIGGGAEVAYWLQLKTLFENFQVFYPPVILRQSVLWVGKKENKLRERLRLNQKDLFLAEIDLINKFIRENSSDDWQTGEEMEIIQHALELLKQKAILLDPTLKSSSEAVLTKIKYQVQLLEKKMLRAEKRKMQDQLTEIKKIKSHLFPGNNLQERVENFIPYFIQYGHEYFDLLMENFEPLRNQFLIIEEQAD